MAVVRFEILVYQKKACGCELYFKMLYKYFNIFYCKKLKKKRLHEK